MNPRSFGYEERDGVATITLDRPDRLNALTFEVYAELRDTFAALDSRAGVRVVVLTGAGKGFCSGGDVEQIIGELLTRDTKALLEFTRMTGALIRNIRALRKPVVASLNGIAAGAGAVVALACDFRVASERAKMAFLFTKVGLAGADMGAAYLLPRIVGLARATEILYLGDVIDAEQAERLGLVTRVVSHDRLREETLTFARRLAAGPAFALGMTKELLNQELDLSFAAAIEAEAEGQALCMLANDFKEGYAAFMEKRAPKFE